MPVPNVTALYAALNAVLIIALASRVSSIRRRDKVSLGMGESKDLLVAVRTHANAAEFVPLALLMMLIAELCGAGTTLLHVYGGLLFAARLAHVVGMPMKAPNPFRVIGTGLTWTAIVVASVWVTFLRAHR
jgi:uncharacterized membrane protein YecN with MAPEG domain